MGRCRPCQRLEAAIAASGLPRKTVARILGISTARLRDYRRMSEGLQSSMGTARPSASQVAAWGMRLADDLGDRAHAVKLAAAPLAGELRERADAIDALP